LKAPTYTSHRQHIGRTVSHIDRCLGDEIDVRMPADMACFSPYHFLRMFQGLTEETPISMVRRLRLERTRRRLASGISIRQAADEAQFVPEGEEVSRFPDAAAEGQGIGRILARDRSVPAEVHKRLSARYRRLPGLVSRGLGRRPGRRLGFPRLQPATRGFEAA
jgi:AraC-like DNA-binding protein